MRTSMTMLRGRRLGAVAVVAGLALVALTACSGGSSAASGTAGSATSGNITWWGWTPDKANADKLIAAFNKEYPSIKVEFVSKPIDSYDSVLSPAITSSQGPDVFNVAPGSANGGVQTFQAGAVDLTSAVEKAGYGVGELDDGMPPSAGAIHRPSTAPAEVRAQVIAPTPGAAPTTGIAPAPDGLLPSLAHGGRVGGRGYAAQEVDHRRLAAFGQPRQHPLLDVGGARLGDPDEYPRLRIGGQRKKRKHRRNPHQLKQSVEQDQSQHNKQFEPAVRQGHAVTAG